MAETERPERFKMERHYNNTKNNNEQAHCHRAECRSLTIPFIAEVVCEDTEFVLQRDTLYAVCPHGHLGDAELAIIHKLRPYLASINKSHVLTRGVVKTTAGYIKSMLRDCVA